MSEDFVGEPEFEVNVETKTPSIKKQDFPIFMEKEINKKLLLEGHPLKNGVKVELIEENGKPNIHLIYYINEKEFISIIGYQKQFEFKMAVGELKKRLVKTFVEDVIKKVYNKYNKETTDDVIEEKTTETNEDGTIKKDKENIWAF